MKSFSVVLCLLMCGCVSPEVKVRVPGAVQSLPSVVALPPRASLVSADNMQFYRVVGQTMVEVIGKPWAEQPSVNAFECPAGMLKELLFYDGALRGLLCRAAYTLEFKSR